MELYDYMNTGFASYDAVASSMDVAFEPVEMDDGSMQYMSMVDDGSSVYLDGDASPSRPRQKKINVLSTMFVGSITILGLYMVYRVMRRTRNL
jgi:hypothetical protein